MDTRASRGLHRRQEPVFAGLTKALAYAVRAEYRLGAGGMGAHVEQYAAQTGESVACAMQKFGLEQPEIPEGFEVVWNWFWELHQGRGHTGFGPLPLGFADMAAWAAISGIELSPWLASALRSMDLAWLDEHAKAQKQKAS